MKKYKKLLMNLLVMNSLFVVVLFNPTWTQHTKAGNSIHVKEQVNVNGDTQGILKSGNNLMAAASVVVAPIAVEFISSDAQVVTKSTTAKTFSDIPTSYMYYQQITDMTKLGIINGNTDGTFKPNANIERRHAAALVSRAMKVLNKDTYVPSTQAYTDIPSTHTYYADVQLLNGLYPLSATNGNFDQTKLLTRGEMAAILVEAFDLPYPTENEYTDNRFSDVSTKYEMYVGALHQAGITTGYPSQGADGLLEFKEKEPLTRAHYAVFMKRALEYYQNALNTESAVVKEARAVVAQYGDIFTDEKAFKNFPYEDFDINPIEVEFYKKILPMVRNTNFAIFTSDYSYSTNVSFVQPNGDVAFSFAGEGNIGGRMTINYTSDDAVAILKETIKQLYSSFDKEFDLQSKVDDFVEKLKTDRESELYPFIATSNENKVAIRYNGATKRITFSIIPQ